jgi:hypothetical protein
MSPKLKQRDIFVFTSVLFVGPADFLNVLIMFCCLEKSKNMFYVYSSVLRPYKSQLHVEWHTEEKQPRKKMKLTFVTISK